VSALAGEEQLVEVARCPLCGSERFATAFVEPPYSVRRCGGCGFGWTSPRLDEDRLQAMYGDDCYWRSGSPKTLGYHDYRADQPLYLDTFRRRLAFVLGDRPRGGRALDVGCAAGFCMAVLRELGFEAFGVEVSGAIAAHARERLGFGEAVHVGTLADAPHPEASFDLITIWDVVEHVVDPHALLVRARELLAPGGLLVIETQDIDSAFARALGPRWHHYKHAEHISHFTPSSARTLLQGAGLRVTRLTHSHAGKYVSLQFIAERAGRIHPLLSRALSPLARIRSARLYLNFFDEMILLAEPDAGDSGPGQHGAG
jgi:2-polyprenyl-3-methyl-5-hydroxy-6-metoxy-1,4-benzoquinol methylase